MSIRPGDASQGFMPTHRVGPAGLATWPAPDPTATAGPPLGPNLDVQVAETSGAWARVMCSNGWSAWVDARQLLAIEGLTGPPMLTQPVIVVTATLRGTSLWGAHARLTVHDEAGAEIGSGGGLGSRGQVWGTGFSLADAGGGTVLTVKTGKKDWAVTDGLERPIGAIESAKKGIARLSKPVYDLRAGQQFLGRVATETLLPRTWAVTDGLEQRVGTISDATSHGRMNRNGSCRLEITASVDLPLRQLIVAQTANEAIGRMQTYNRPRQWA